MEINIYIGTEKNQLIPQKVLEYSIRTNSKAKLNIYPVFQEFERVGGTNFGFVRFLVPKMNNFKGKAIYLDADQLVFADIKELLDTLDDKHSIALVNDPKGFFGKKKLEKGNQTSVMVLNCSKLTSWSPKKMFKNVVPNKCILEKKQIHYRDFMSLQWINKKNITGIDPRWNHFNIIEPGTKLTHFSHVRSQPWKNPSHPLTSFWGGWLQHAIKDGAVGRIELLKEILRGSVHFRFLRNIFVI